jgi:hypothetical protein
MSKKKKKDKTEPQLAPIQTGRFKYTDVVIPLILIIAFYAFCHITPSEARGFNMRPDSPQYSIGAYNLFTEGRYVIYVNDAAYPPAYSFGYPLFILPFYAVFGAEPGNAVIASQFAGAAALVLLYFLGVMIHSRIAGTIAALLLLFGSVLFRFSARLPMSDAPHLMLVLLMFVLVLNALRSAGWRRAVFWAGAGFAFGFIVSMRVASVFYGLFPLFASIFASGRSPRKILFDMLPFAAGALPWAVAIAAFNYANFGGFTRTGYNYWWSNPFDFLSRAFVFAPFAPDKNGILNQLHRVGGLQNDWATTSVVFFIATYALWVIAIYGILKTRKNRADKKDGTFGAVFSYLVIASGVCTLFHFFYFAKDWRFYLQITPIVYLFASAGLIELARSWKPEYGRRAIERMLMPAAAACIIFHAGFSISEIPKFPPPGNNFFDTYIGKYEQAQMPKDAVIMCDYDSAVVTHYLVRGTNRTIFPLSRSAASENTYPRSMVMPKKPESASGYPDDPEVRRTDGIRKAGGVDIFPEVALENADKIIEYLQSGRQVFTDRMTLVQSKAFNQDESGRMIFIGTGDAKLPAETRLIFSRLKIIPVSNMVCRLDMD